MQKADYLFQIISSFNFLMYVLSDFLTFSCLFESFVTCFDVCPSLSQVKQEN